MIKRFCGGVILATLFCGASVGASEKEKIAYLQEMLDEQKRVEKNKIEERFADKRSRIWGELASTFALTTLTGVFTADAIIKLVNTGMDVREMTVACAGGVAVACLLVRIFNNLDRLQEFAAQKQEMLDQLEEQAREFKAEIRKQAKQAREEARRAREEKNVSDNVKAEASVSQDEEREQEPEGAVAAAEIDKSKA